MKVYTAEYCRPVAWVFSKHGSWKTTGRRQLRDEKEERARKY